MGQGTRVIDKSKSTYPKTLNMGDRHYRYERRGFKKGVQITQVFFFISIAPPLGELCQEAMLTTLQELWREHRGRKPQGFLYFTRPEPTLAIVDFQEEMSKRKHHSLTGVPRLTTSPTCGKKKMK